MIANNKILFRFLIKTEQIIQNSNYIRVKDWERPTSVQSDLPLGYAAFLALRRCSGEQAQNLKAIAD